MPKNYAKAVGYAQHVVAPVPQSEPLDERQVPNSGGGFSYAVDDWARLNRFLVLGSEGGSYYATERKLTRENAAVVERCLRLDPVRTVKTIVEISDGGRAPKNDPAIFALALAARNDGSKHAAFAALPDVCRIGTHLFQFMNDYFALRGASPGRTSAGGLGRVARRGLGAWYSRKDDAALAVQLCKYRGRVGWTHRDALRVIHAPYGPRPLLEWAVKGKVPDSVELPEVVGAYARAQEAKTAKELIAVIESCPALTWEMLPSELLGEAEVWRALIPRLPMTALLRNLARMTANGALASMTEEAKVVAARLVDPEALKKARVHPIAVLAAMYTYAAGHGTRGSLVWKPVGTINDALDSAFYASFGNVVPHGKRTRVGLDVSGSMNGGEVAGVPGLTPRVAASALAMVWAKTEPNVEFVAFSGGLIPIDISRSRSVRDVMASTNNLPFSATDCALPISDADAGRVERDVFLIVTDSETNVGTIHPKAALDRYRRRVPGAKLCVAAVVSNGFSIADPQDGGMLDCVGFDTATPNLITDFAMGKV